MSIKPWNFAPTCSKILLPGPQLLRWAVLSFPYSNSWHHKHPPVPATTRQEQTDAVPGKGRDTAGGTAKPDAIPGVCSVPLLLASFRKIKLADFQVFSFYPHSPRLLSLQQALTGWNVGLCPTEYIFKLLPHEPNAKLKHTSLRAAETVTWRAWDVFKDLSGPCFDCQMQQRLENFDHQQGPASLLSPSPPLPPWQEIKSLF